VLRTTCFGFAIALSACGGTSSTPRATTPLVVTSADLRPGADGQPALIAPSRLEMHRLRGEKIITPDDDTKHAVAKSRLRLVGTFKLCLDTSGQPTSVDMLQSTGVASYDQRILNEMRRWAFTPVVLDGKPIPICTAVTFIFTAR
jgi:hypothetical protein